MQEDPNAPEYPELRYAVTIEEILQAVAGYHCEHEEFDTLWELQEAHDSAANAFSQAELDKQPCAQLQKLRELRDARAETLELARQVYIALNHERQRIQSGEPSSLQCESTNMADSEPRFMTHAVYAWLIEKFAFQVEQWAPYNSPTKDESGAGSTADSNPSSRDLRDDAKRNYELTIAALTKLLVEAKYSGTSSQKFGTPAKPKKSAIAEAVTTELEHLAEGERGFTKDTLANKLGDCLRRLPPKPQ